jgi:hypothetical protein
VAPSKYDRDDQSRFDDDPEPVEDETDPTFEAEVFDVLRHMGLTPEQISDKAKAKRYAKWLKTAPPE